MSSRFPTQTQLQSSSPNQIPTLTKPQPPIPWTHEETLNLIRAYQEKWYSLNRGQLRASQWEEVALAIASLCGLDQPSKSGTQCRHKLEKLRKRFRAEKHKNSTLSASISSAYHSWVYYPLMEQLEQGIPVSLPTPVPSQFPPFTHEGRMHIHASQTDSRRGYEPEFGNRQSYWEKGEIFSTGDDGEYDDQDDVYVVIDEEEEEEGECEKVDVVGQLGAEMRGFVERFVKIEKKKMEIMRENERFKWEMENKRLEMILVSQQKTVEMITKVFGVDSSADQEKMEVDQDL